MSPQGVYYDNEDSVSTVFEAYEISIIILCVGSLLFVQVYFN